MKKGILIVCAVLILALVAASIPFFPRAVTGDAGSISDLQIFQNGEKVSLSEEDAASLKQALSELKCRRAFGRITPYEQDKITYELQFISEGKPMHLVLGETSFCYESAGLFSEFVLMDSEAFTQQISSICG